MNIEQAIVIKTQSPEQTLVAQQLREEIQGKGHDVVLVPYSVNGLLITKADGQLVVITKHFVPVTEEERILDAAKGFDSEYECWQYAKLVAYEAKIQEHFICSDVVE